MTGLLDDSYRKDFKTKKKNSDGSKVGSSGAYVTVNGYQKSHVVSALQKMIRRGQEPEALYWASELLASNMAYDFWRRISAITAEDIGLGDPDMPGKIAGLNNLSRLCQEWNIPFMAVALLCRSPKNREMDDAAWMYEMRRKEGWKIPIPRVAIDGHTREGKGNLYAVARANNESFDRAWGREFYHDAALLKGYVPVVDPNDESGEEDRYRHALLAMPEYNLPYDSYEVDGPNRCKQPRILTGNETHRQILASRVPEEVQYRQKGNQSTGEAVPGVYEVLSFTDGKTVYDVDLMTEPPTCTCPAFANGMGRPCKHILGVERKVNAL